MEFRNGVSVSDDGGKTWTVHYPVGEEIRINGQRPACLLFDRGHVLELDDGTLARTCQAWLTKDHQKRGLVSSIIVRSSGGGATWSDASLIAMADEDEDFVWRELHVAVLPDGRWFVVIRSESFKWIGNAGEDCFLSAYVSWSSDQGHTWTKPRPLTLGAEAEAEVVACAPRHLAISDCHECYHALCQLSRGGFSGIRRRSEVVDVMANSGFACIELSGVSVSSADWQLAPEDVVPVPSGGRPWIGSCGNRIRRSMWDRCERRLSRRDSLSLVSNGYVSCSLSNRGWRWDPPGKYG